MAADILYSKIYGSVAHIKNQAERMDALKEDARKLHRYLKRAEAIVSDLQPYYIQQQTLQPLNSTAAEDATPDVSTAAQVLAGLHGVQAVLSEVQDMLEQACSRGKLSTYLQADRLLQQFQSAVSDLESSVANLPCSPTLLGSAYDETTEQLDSLRSALRKVKFELSKEHAQQLGVYRDACDSLQGPLQQLQGSCRDILQQVCGHTSLTRDEFAAAVADLQQEVRQLQQHHQQQQANGIATSGSLRSHSSTGSQQQQQQPGTPTAGSAVDAPQQQHQQQQHEKVEIPQQQQQQQQQQQNDEFYLRMMCDLLRVNHQHEGVPLEFTCPLTTAVMHDPVILHETGHSYERQAIEDWFASGHRLCPKSGTTLGKKLSISPNHALKAAIRTWCEQNDLQLKFRPLLRGAVAESKNLFTPAFGAPLDSNGRPLPASSTSGQLGTILAAGSGGISPSSSTSTDLDAIEGSSSSKPPGGISLVGTGNATAVVGGGIGSAYVEAVPCLKAANISGSSVSGGQSVELVRKQHGSLMGDKQADGITVDQGEAGGLPEAMEPGLPVSKQLHEVGEAAADAPAGAE